jgi:hypothetical protein
LEYAIQFLKWILNKLLSLYIRPNIKVKEFSINQFENKADVVDFALLITNRSEKAMSISEKKLFIYNKKTLIGKIEIVKYEIVRKNDGFDTLNILTPIDEIIYLQPGETKRISIFKEIENSHEATRIIFSYYNGMKSIEYKIPMKSITYNTKSNHVYL